ncbi:hypothetical protein [Priestia megaterium]|uniref:hypothetical protein n=1 Tax=Priestia megaterium TaxID=1404 RepID=UPI000BF6B253|nr:hypothetical protein [Priestia megaterium]PFQ82046.1 hypothetical protein COK11_16330 [Priestia megaterium]
MVDYDLLVRYFERLESFYNRLEADKKDMFINQEIRAHRRQIRLYNHVLDNWNFDRYHAK